MYFLPPPCAMVVPDFELLAEIMLVAEGFSILARKFLTLYTLCKDLLSKQHHYDWGLRAIAPSLQFLAGWMEVFLNLGERVRACVCVCAYVCVCAAMHSEVLLHENTM